MKRKTNNLPDFEHTPPPPDMGSKMIDGKTWNEFRKTGLFMFINTVLHTFGWALVVEMDGKGEVANCYPARVKFRGFSERDQTEMHKKIGAYLKENAAELEKEAHE